MNEVLKKLNQFKKYKLGWHNGMGEPLNQNTETIFRNLYNLLKKNNIRINNMDIFLGTNGDLQYNVFIPNIIEINIHIQKNNMIDIVISPNLGETYTYNLHKYNINQLLEIMKEIKDIINKKGQIFI